MVKKNYQAMQESHEKTARAIGKNKPVSTKYATEICREIKGKPVSKIEDYLKRVIEHKDFIPLKKYNKKVGHRKGDSKSGVKSGRYPENTCKAFLDILESVKANADFKGLDAEKLLIIHAFASEGFRRNSYQSKGRIAGKRRKKKSTHIEIVVMEAA